jgi:GntR family transcriptional regulator/MocR family aminotransferase
VAALARHLPEARLYGVAAGLHALVRLPGDVDEARLTEESAARGIAFGPMAAHRVAPSGADWPGAVLGYANLPEPTIERGVQELAAAVATVRR